MRYLHLIRQSLPGFAIVGVMLGASGAGNGIWRPLFGGVAAGVVLGAWALGPLRRKLIEGEEHWTMREVPGGIWFFLGLGAALGVLAVMLASKDEGLAVDLGLGLCVMLFAGFALIGIWVRRQEKRHNKEVWVGPGGPEFRAPD